MDYLFETGTPITEEEALATLGFIAAMVYSLWMVQRVFTGNYAGDGKTPDLDRREFALFAVQALALIILGLYPQPVLDTVRPALANIQSDAAVSMQKPASTEASANLAAPEASVDATSVYLNEKGRP